MKLKENLLQIVGAAACAALAIAWQFKEPEKPCIGFVHPAEQHALEGRFDSSLKAADLDAWMRRLSARPHHLGSAYDKENADFIASLFTQWGWKVRIEEFSALFPTPKTRIVEQLEPEKFTAALVEPPLPEDSTSGQTGEQLPTYNAYSIDGDVTGTLVYVNYGIPKDYDELQKRGIDVKGKIVIARYGGSWRGIKPKVAAEHGAIGCIIYSDPRDDGYFEGDVYPKGAYRNERGAQRGSVADMPMYAGDPSTPFVGAVKGVKHQAVKEVQVLTKIPVLPISFADALPFLRSLGGQVAPEEWRGALPITYHLGPGPTKLHMKVEFNWDIVPVYDVIAKIEGSERPEQWIIRGNHHDAWVNGAEDPTSGLVAMLEEAKGIGGLLLSGWKPKRTIIYCAWDGEEPGLIGSTEWAETHAEELRKHAAVYINSDANGRGFLSLGGSHALEKFVNEVAHDVTDPQKGVSVFERAKANRLVNGTADERKDLADRNELAISALGSGSDYTPFLQHLGISSLSVGYGGEDGGGSYHSIYDSYSHYSRFGDPGFRYGVALAQTGGRIVLRLADADMFPFDFTSLADAVGKYVREVMKLADEIRDATQEENKMIKEKAFELAADPREEYVGPREKDPVPYLNFAPLQNALTSLQQRAKEFSSVVRELEERRIPLSLSAHSTLDEILMKAERSFTRPDGLPHRPWFVHYIYAPGQYTGYGVKTLPGVREAIELRHWKEAEDQVEVVSKVIESYAREIQHAVSFLRTALQ